MRPELLALIHRWVLPIAFAAWSFVFVAFLGTALPAFDPVARIVAQVAYVAPLAAWAVWRLRGPRDELDLAILAGLVLTFAVSVASLDLTGSLEALALALSVALLFWAMRELGSMAALRTSLATGSSLAIALWLLIAASTWVGEKVNWIAAGGGVPPLDSSRIFGWSSPNTFPAMMLLGLPIFLAAGPTVARRALLIVFVACSVVVLPFSVGRAGYLGIGVALVAYELLRGAPLVRNPRSRRVLAGVALLVGGGLVWLWVTRGEELTSSLLGTRISIWQQAISIFADRPLTGAGPSTFHWLRLEHAPDYGDRVGVYLAHNVVLQTMADGGLLLLLALGVVLVAFASVAWRRRDRADRWSRVALAALIGYAAASLFDDFSTFNAMTAMAVTLAAWVVGPSVARVAVPGRLALVAPAGVTFLGLVALPAVVAVAGARLDAQAARNAAVEGDWTAASERFGRASQQHRVDAAYHLGRGLVLAQSGDLAGSREAYEIARRQASGDPRPYGALAALSEDPEERLELLDLAARRTQRDPEYAYRLALERLAAGRTDAAASAFALAALIEPRLLGALPPEIGFNDLTFAMVARLTALRNQGEVIDDTIAWELALANGRIAGEAGAAWRAVGLVVAGDTEGALATAREAVREQPYDPRSYHALRYAAHAGCDEARRARAESILALLDETDNTFDAVRESWDTAYREEGLGDYQPPKAVRMPELEPWPEALVGPPPPCD